MSDGPFRFQATVETGTAGFACVRVPQKFSASIGTRGQVPVIAFINDFETEATLHPVGDGTHTLNVNSKVRHGAGVRVGDRVTVELAVDRRQREVELPEDVAAALRAAPEALAEFELYPYSHKKAYLEYVEEVKKPDARERRIRSMIEGLLEQASKRVPQDA